LGEGQAGVVWKATVLKHSRGIPAGSTVAVKKYKRWVLEEAGQYERIYRELKAGSAIENANLVRDSWLGVDERRSSSTRNAVLRGRDSGRVSEITPHAAPTDRLQICVHVIGAIGASALAALHEQGIIHRDAKPANIVIEKTGIPILMDLDLHDFNESSLDGRQLENGTRDCRRSSSTRSSRAWLTVFLALVMVIIPLTNLTHSKLRPSEWSLHLSTGAPQTIVNQTVIRRAR
jgi:serine/threonine protein kinase